MVGSRTSEKPQNATHVLANDRDVNSYTTRNMRSPRAEGISAISIPFFTLSVTDFEGPWNARRSFCACVRSAELSISSGH